MWGHGLQGKGFASPEPAGAGWGVGQTRSWSPVGMCACVTSCPAAPTGMCACVTHVPCSSCRQQLPSSPSCPFLLSPCALRLCTGAALPEDAQCGTGDGFSCLYLRGLDGAFLHRPGEDKG